MGNDQVDYITVAERLVEGKNPLSQAKKAMRRSGYGGSLRVPLLLYIAATTRVLEMPRGHMPAHVALLGTTSAGKNYALDMVLNLLPEATYHEIDAGSPRALIYDELSDLRHRIVVFREVDSLPTGEDNPAASAIRNLLQDHHLHYAVVEKVDGIHQTRHIKKAGPTVLFTTTTRRLPPQMSSRVFYIEIPETQRQIRKALAVIGSMYEGNGANEEPPKRLVKYQAILQKLAPWKVVVPYSKAISNAVGLSPREFRVMRDFHRLMALVQAVTVLNFWQRQRDPEGRLIAEISDYAVVWKLMRDTFDVSADGIGRNVRRTIDAVAALRKAHPKPMPITAADVARHLKLNKMTTLRYVKESIQGGWLMNHADGSRGRPYELDLGESLPEDEGLPSPRALSRMIARG